MLNNPLELLESDDKGENIVFDVVKITETIDQIKKNFQSLVINDKKKEPKTTKVIINSQYFFISPFMKSHMGTFNNFRVDPIKLKFIPKKYWAELNFNKRNNNDNSTKIISKDFKNSISRDKSQLAVSGKVIDQVSNVNYGRNKRPYTFLSDHIKLYKKEDNEGVEIKDLIQSYFCLRSSKINRFEFKLFNALQITLYYPSLFPIIGVMWKTPTVIKVNRVQFGLFLGMKKSGSGLFSVMGAFPSHGFIELSPTMLKERNVVLSNDDILNNHRFIEHHTLHFNIGSQEEEVIECNWTPEVSQTSKKKKKNVRGKK